MEVIESGVTQQHQQDVYWMELALNLAKQAEVEGEVPVGAVIVQNNQIIGSGYNQPISTHNACAHAEINAIRAAGQAIKNYRLNKIDHNNPSQSTTLYVTLEPCAMCAMAMVHARIQRLVYAADDPKTGAVNSVFQLFDEVTLNHKVEIASGILQQPCNELLTKFFQRIRNKKYK